MAPLNIAVLVPTTENRLAVSRLYPRSQSTRVKPCAPQSAGHRVHLIGRKHDLALARTEVLESDGRLLTMTGTGGCGKTHLALGLASCLLDEFRDGVWLIELAPLADPALVPQSVLSTIGLRERSGEPLVKTLALTCASSPPVGSRSGSLAS